MIAPLCLPLLPSASYCSPCFFLLSSFPFLLTLLLFHLLPSTPLLSPLLSYLFASPVSFLFLPASLCIPCVPYLLLIPPHLPTYFCFPLNPLQPPFPAFPAFTLQHPASPASSTSSSISILSLPPPAFLCLPLPLFAFPIFTLDLPIKTHYIIIVSQITSLCPSVRLRDF